MRNFFEKNLWKIHPLSQFGWQLLKEILKRWSHVLTRVLIHAFTHVFDRVLVCVLTCIFTCIFTCVHTRVLTRLFTRVLTCVHTRVLTRLFTRVLTCVHTRVLIPFMFFYLCFLARTHLMLNHLVFFTWVCQLSFICSFLWAVLRLRKGTYGRYLFSYSRVSINYIPVIYWLHVGQLLVIF